MPKAEAFSLLETFRSWFGGNVEQKAAPSTLTTTRTTTTVTATAKPQAITSTTRRTLGIVDGREVIEEIGFGTGKLLFMPTDGNGQAFVYTFDPISTVFTVTGNTVTGFNKADNTFLKISPADSGFSRSTVNSVTGDVIESAAIPAFQGIGGAGNLQMD
jgi:hypothetical protein